MRVSKFALVGGAVFMGMGFVGCQHDNSKKPTVNVPTHEMNDRTAEDRVHEAEQAEKEGKYARAIEIYETLRAYPPASRPTDLDARIQRLRDKMKHSAQ